MLSRMANDSNQISSQPEHWKALERQINISTCIIFPNQRPSDKSSFLTGIVESKNQNSHFLGSKQAFEDSTEQNAHSRVYMTLSYRKQLM